MPRTGQVFQGKIPYSLNSCCLERRVPCVAPFCAIRSLRSCNHSSPNPLYDISKCILYKISLQYSWARWSLVTKSKRASLYTKCKELTPAELSTVRRSQVWMTSHENGEVHCIYTYGWWRSKNKSMYGWLKQTSQRGYKHACAIMRHSKII